MAFMIPIFQAIGGMVASGVGAAGAAGAGTAAAGAGAAAAGGTLTVGSAAATAASGAAAASAATAGLTTAQMVALGMTTTSSVLSAVGSIAQGQTMAAMEEAQAKYAGYQAADAIARGNIEEEQHRLKVRQFLGTQRATQAAQGLDIGTGSPLTQQLDTIEMGELDALQLRSNAAREAYGYRNKASAHRAGAKNARRAGYYGAGTSLLTGTSDAYGIWRGV